MMTSFIRYHLFKQIDDSGAGYITFAEFERALRSHLHVTRSQLPDEQVLAIWLMLDKDQNSSRMQVLTTAP